MALKANKSLVICNIGGSNCIGSGTGATVLTVPAGCSYRINSVATGPAYPNPHSIIPGLLDELKNVIGYGGAISVLQWGIATTDLASWIATHGPNFLADWAASGLAPPCVIIHDFGGGDSQDGAHLNAADDNQDTLYASFHRKMGAAAIFLMGLTPAPTVPPYTFAGLVGGVGANYGILTEQLEYGARRPTLMGVLDTRPLPYGSVGADLTHRLTDGQIAGGRYVGRWIYNNGLLP